MAIVPPTSQGSSSFALLASSTLAAPAATIDFTGISASATSLSINIMAMTSDAAAQLMGIRFNGDAGANYDTQSLNGGGAIASAAETFAATSGGLTFVAQSALSPLASYVQVLVPFYAGTTFNKVALSTGAIKIGTAAGNLGTSARTAYWRSSAAINQVTLVLAAGNFITGSQVSIYGIT